MDLRGIAQSKPLSLEALGFLAALRWGDFKPAAGCIYPVGWKLVYSLVGIDWLLGRVESAVSELVERGLIWVGGETSGPIVVACEIQAPRSEAEARRFAEEIAEVARSYAKGGTGRELVDRARLQIARVSPARGAVGGLRDREVPRAEAAPERPAAPLLRLVPTAGTDQPAVGTADRGTDGEGAPCTP